jgi:hypothetical protein
VGPSVDLAHSFCAGFTGCKDHNRQMNRSSVLPGVGLLPDMKSSHPCSSIRWFVCCISQS